MGYQWQRHEFLVSLHHFAIINAARGNRFHRSGMEEWSALEWAGAMTGEVGEISGAVLELLAYISKHAGECANACKKLRRMELESFSKNNFADVAQAKKAIASEIAGTFVYLDLLATRLGINLGEAIITEFNRVSAREGFEEVI